MRDFLLQTLRGLGYGEPILQGSMADDEPYPESFITYQTIGSPEQDFFDNEPGGVVWKYAIIFYTSNPELLSTEPTRIYDTLKAVGFVPQGRGTDILSDEPTHTGWVNEYHYLQT
jgi:hypothetical protein